MRLIGFASPFLSPSPARISAFQTSLVRRKAVSPLRVLRFSPNLVLSLDLNYSSYMRIKRTFMEESCKNLRHPNTKIFWLPIKIYNRFPCELHEVVTVDVDRDLSTTCCYTSSGSEAAALIGKSVDLAIVISCISVLRSVGLNVTVNASLISMCRRLPRQYEQPPGVPVAEINSIAVLPYLKGSQPLPRCLQEQGICSILKSDTTFRSHFSST